MQLHEESHVGVKLYGSGMYCVFWNCMIVEYIVCSGIV
jgi:hypothetical protein